MTRTAPIGLFCVTLVAVTGCAGTARSVVATPERAVPVERNVPPAPPPPQNPQGVVHSVAAGETLYAISRAYAVSVQALTAANALSDPNRLAVGQRIFVPGAVATLPVPPPLASVAGDDGGDYLWPVAGGAILSHFGAPRGSRLHQGLDIGGRHGQPVLAVAAGRVAYSDDRMRGYGKTVIIDHGNGVQSLYAHNSKLMVREGQRVLRGQAIARVGRSGNASTEHCHLEIRQGDVARDPLQFIARDTGSRR